MSIKRVYMMLFLSIVLLGLGLFYFNLKKTLREEEVAFDNFRKISTELISLENRWNNDKEKNIIFKKLRRYRVKIVSKNSLEFSNLSQKGLNRVIKMLLNSGLIIKSMDFVKQGEKIKLKVEVKS